MIKCIVSDLDGTLVRTSMVDIEDKTIALLVKYQKAGGLVVLASGRPMAMMIPVAKLLKLDVYGGVLIANNGYQILDYSTGGVLENRDDTIKPCVIEEVVKFSKSHISFLSIETLNRVFTFGSPLVSYLRKLYFKVKMRKNAHGTFGEYTTIKQLDQVQGNVMKLGIAGLRRRDILSLQNLLRTHYDEYVESVRVTSHYIDITPKGINKGAILLEVLERRGIDPLATVAFGDGENDITMLEVVGTGVAMDNAMDTVKAKADHITLKNSQNGVRVYLESLLGHIIE